MWSCPNCQRTFQKNNQSHSCEQVTLESHFRNKQKAKALFNFLHQQIKRKIGPTKVISLPCCVHLFGPYDFMAVLPKKNKLEVRFALAHRLATRRLKSSTPISRTMFKQAFDISSPQEIDQELLGWVKESYHLKDAVAS